MIENVFLSIEVKRRLKKAGDQAGCEYEMARNFFLRLGVSTAEISKVCRWTGLQG